MTRRPYRLQSEQDSLTRIIEGKLKSDPNYRIEFGRRVCGARQDTATIAANAMAAARVPSCYPFFGGPERCALLMNNSRMKLPAEPP